MNSNSIQCDISGSKIPLIQASC